VRPVSIHLSNELLFSMTNHSPTADTCDLPTREDVQELRQAIESLRDHVQIVWQAIDEVREVIGQTVGHDAAEFWNIEPPQDLPLGRYRPFAGYEPFDEWSAENHKPVELSPALQTSPSDGAPDAQLPADVSADVGTAVAACLRESQGQGGMDSLAGSHRHDTNNPQPIPVANGATQQRPLWREDAAEPQAAASTANGLAEAAQAVTPQKEAEPGAGWFVRPDRQASFAGLPQYEWPKAEEDRDTICVDRIYTEPPGVTHRFTIRRSDTVEVFFAKDRLEIGKVIGISQAKGEARVQFDGRGEGIWFYKGKIYPAGEPEPATSADAVPLSTALAKTESEPADGSQPADRVTNNGEAANNSATSVYFAPLAGHELTSLMHRHKVTIGELAKRTGMTQKRIRQARDDGLSEPNIVRDWLQAILGRDPGPIGERPLSEPYTLDDWIAFRRAFSDGQVDAAGIRQEFRRMKAGKQHFIDELLKGKSADQLKLMAMQFGSYDARQNTKQQNAASIYRSRLSAFTLGDAVRYSPMQETYEEAVERIVLAVTDESIAAQREKNQLEREAREKALTNPETFQEYSQFVSRNGTGQLSDEQLATWDRLNADISRGARKQKQNDTVGQFQSAEIAGVEFRIIAGFHEREQVPLWIVQLTNRVERETFNELKIKASQLGGWWSSFKKDAMGFQFRAQESAEKFAGLTEGDANRSEELLARKLRKMDSASERLSAVAESLEEKAAAVLAADDQKLKNTARRADMAASMRAQASRDQADAKTLRSIAAALAAGGATYLDGVWNAAQVRTLETILRQARRERINRRLKEEGNDRRTHGWSQRYDELETEPLSAADARFATFPKPYLYRGHLVQAFAQLGNTPGVKQATAKMQKLVGSSPKNQDFVEFVNDYQVELLEDFLGRAKAAGTRIFWFDHCLESYKRLRSAHIDDNHELRTALRELVPHLATAAGDDPVTRAEDELRGKQLDGFFPTPRRVIEQMLDLAGIEQTHRILEPSCGKGDILDAIRREHPDVDLTAVEKNLTLQGVLTAKGFSDIVSYGDFLEHGGEYDRVLMNPPFEHGQDIEHVRHAYELLARGGRLVSVVCEGPFFRSDAKSVAFREWLDECGADVEQLPEDAFAGVDAFRQTGVKTRLVTIDKP